MGSSGAHLEILNGIGITFLECCQHDDKVSLTQVGILEKALFQEIDNGCKLVLRENKDLIIAINLIMTLAELTTIVE